MILNEVLSFYNVIIYIMDEVAYKCYLGLALEKTINELGLESIKDKIFEIYNSSFNDRFEHFKKGLNETSRGTGQIMEHYEYPIGEQSKLQYFQAYGKISFNSGKVSHLRVGEHNSMIECFSNNTDPRTKRNKSKLKGPRENPSKRKKTS